MKKLFSLASVLLLFLVLTGCANETEGTDLQQDLEAQAALISDLEQQVIDLNIALQESTNSESDLALQIISLENQIAELQALIYDNVITFTLKDEYGIFTSETVGYNDDFDGTLFDLLDQNFLVGYTDSEWGKYIYSIDYLTPKTGAYIAFYKNGAMSLVGIDSTLFEDGDVFSFEVTWWDMQEKAVDDAIYLFLDAYGDFYVSETSIDYNVISALALLGVVDEYVTLEEVQALVDEMTLTTVNDYFKAVMMLQAVNGDTDSLISDLNSIVAVGPYGQTAYGLLALDSYNHSIDYSSFISSALNDLTTTTPYDLGLDAGGISLVSLSNYSEEPGIQAIIDEYATWISTSQLASGGVQTRDITWGDTTYPGTENAASISQVILGLIANDINPTSVDYTKTENNLISRLLEYQTATNSFDYVLDDDIAEDLMFSSPQAFLALVTYQTYVNSYEAVNPYNFN